MKVRLNIEEDSELRAAIKEAIKGQVVSIAREEVVKILADILAQKVPTVDPDKILREEIVRSVRNAVDNGGWNKPSFIQEEARKEVQKIIKELLAKNPIV